MIEVKLHQSLTKQEQRELVDVIARGYLQSAEMQKIYGSNITALKYIFRMIIAIYSKHPHGRFYIVYKDSKMAGAFTFTLGEIAHNSLFRQLANGLLYFLMSAKAATIKKIMINSGLQKQFEKKYYNSETDIAGIFIAVAPEYQGRGIIARRLFDQIKADFQGKRNIYFETVSKDALKIYQGLGFKKLDSAPSSGSEIVAMKAHFRVETDEVKI